ncbi:MAG TPA: glycosyltransferase, partial [Chloroflexi bacterium]|nr:glycosyltransferase [Chloroflexota bacterium]
MSSKPTYTIIAPIYNEIENIQVLYQRVSEVMEGTGERWEFVMVDDGSTDGSTQAILDLKTKDDKIVPVIFARNFGHQIAVTAGLDHSQGEAVVIIDADLQDPPEVILDLIAKWKEGYEVVYAQRSKREGETWFKLFTAAAFYRTIQRITDVNLPMDTGDFRLLDRKVVDVMGDMREKHRFLRGMSVWVGFRQIGVEYERAERFAGETKYPLKKMFRLASDAITGFSYFPLQLATYLGFTAAGLGLLVLLVVIIARLAGSQFLAGQAV